MRGAGTLAALRQATAGRHAAVESLLGLDGGFGRAHYGQVVRGFESFLCGWEPQLRQALPQHLQDWFTDGCRGALARQDLASLGLTPAPRACPPALAGLPEALGSLYVMEGAALGGQVIAAAAGRQLGLDAGNGAAFFHGCGRGTGARWREVRRLLAQELDHDPAGQARAVSAACATFDGLLDRFGLLLHERAPA